MLGISKSAFTTARRNFRSLQMGLELRPIFRSYEKFKRGVADDAVKFILSRENVKYLSWGTLKLNGVEFPKLVRTRVPEMIHRAYVARFPDPADVDESGTLKVTKRIGPTTFLKVVNAITATDMNVRCCCNALCLSRPS